jgi:hypothetical protein
MLGRGPATWMQPATLDQPPAEVLRIKGCGKKKIDPL